MGTGPTAMAGGADARTERIDAPIGGVGNVAEFKSHVESLHLCIPCDGELEAGARAPLAGPLAFNGRWIGNRFCIHPMEGWDASAEGRPGPSTFRPWQTFGLSGAKLILGAAAVAVCHERAPHPNLL